MSELAEQAQVTKQSMAELVEYLVKFQYLERVPDPVDHRAKIVRLTARGRKAVAAVESILEDIYADWRKLFGPKRFAELHRMLYEIVTREP